MTQVELQVVNRLGMHARAAARFVRLACQFESRITVGKDDSRVDGKSILGLLALAAGRGSQLRMTVEGPDELAAAEALAELVMSRFGEES